LRLMDSCITQLKAQGPSRTCNESKEEGWGSDLRLIDFVYHSTLGVVAGVAGWDEGVCVGCRDAVHQDHGLEHQSCLPSCWTRVPGPLPLSLSLSPSLSLSLSFFLSLPLSLSRPLSFSFSFSLPASLNTAALAQGARTVCEGCCVLLGGVRMLDVGGWTDTPSYISPLISRLSTTRTHGTPSDISRHTLRYLASARHTHPQISRARRVAAFQQTGEGVWEGILDCGVSILGTGGSLTLR